jgi:hypothetical protein
MKFNGQNARSFFSHSRTMQCVSKQKAKGREGILWSFGWGRIGFADCLSFSHSPAFAEEGRDSFWL